MIAKAHQQQRKLFTEQEDELLLKYYNEVSNNKWHFIASKLPGRTPRQCRDRYNNYLNPDLHNKDWTLKEEEELKEKVLQYGLRWSLITTFFPGRSSNNVKNRWYKHINRGGKLIPKNYSSLIFNLDQRNIKVEKDKTHDSIWTICQLFPDEELPFQWNLSSM